MNNINKIPYISSIVSLIVGLRHDRSHYDACQKWLKSVDHSFLDRIDIQVEIEPEEFDDMANRQPAEPSTIADLESAQNLPPRSSSGSNSSEANGVPSAEYMGALTAAVTVPVEARHIAEAIGYRALDRPTTFGIAY